METPVYSLRRSQFVLLSCLIAALPARADDTAKATGECKGFGFNGQFAKNIAERDGNGGKETVGKSQKDELKTLQAQLKKKFETCKSKVGQGMDVQGFDAIERRMAQAQKAHAQYIDDSHKLCQQVDQAQAQTMKQADEMVAAKNQSSLTAFQNEAKLLGNNQERYAGLEKSAESAKQNVEKNFPGNQADKDPRMEAAIQDFKENLNRQLKYYSDQTAHELKDRASSTSGEFTFSAVRFRTQAQVDDFYRGISYCRTLTKDLDSFGKKYQKLSKDLANAQKEAGEAGQKFTEWRAEAAQGKKEMEARATSLDESSGAEKPRQPAKEVRRPSPMNGVEGFALGDANADAIFENKTEAASRTPAGETKPAEAAATPASTPQRTTLEDVTVSSLNAQKGYSAEEQLQLIEEGGKSPGNYNPIARMFRNYEGTFTGADGKTYDVYTLQGATSVRHYALPR